MATGERAAGARGLRQGRRNKSYEQKRGQLHSECMLSQRSGVRAGESAVSDNAITPRMWKKGISRSWLMGDDDKLCTCR